MDSTFGTVIEETVFPMDISQHGILKFTRNYVNGPGPTNALASTIDGSVDFNLSGVSVILTEAAAKDEIILKLRKEIASLKQEQEGRAI